ncbi:MAG: hypothetical protein QM775_35110 [Pirellulales bacterium]
MTLAFDPAGDFAAFDLRQNVLVRNPRETASRSMPAVRRSATRSDAHASQGRLLTDLAVFHLPADGEQHEPQIGATITEADGTTWTLVELRREAGGARLRCLCRRREITAELSKFVTIYRAVWQQTSAGVPVAQWIELRRVPAVHVQPIDDAVARQADAVSQAGNSTRRSATHRTYFAERLDLDDNCRLRSGDCAYDVVGLDEQGSVEPGLVVLLELVPGGWSP